MKNSYLLPFLILLIAAGCKSSSNEKVTAAKTSEEVNTITTSRHKHTKSKVDSILVINTVKTLSSDEFEGRKTGQKGNYKAQAYLAEQFKKLNLLSFADNYVQSFPCKIAKKKTTGKNLVAYIKGTEFPDQYLAVTAHYDHEGIKKGEIYNGADDNASGIGGLLGIAEYFTKHPPKHSLLFLAFDAEESGLQGSYFFADHPMVDLKQIQAVINMDMISRNPNWEIYASGTAHFPFLKPTIEKAAQKHPAVHVLFGHDQPKKTRTDLQDWSYSSDHAPFLKKGIPAIYFGVEDHPDYHKPSDDFEKINRNFYLAVVNFILDFTAELDQQYPKVLEK